MSTRIRAQGNHDEQRQYTRLKQGRHCKTDEHEKQYNSEGTYLAPYRDRPSPSSRYENDEQQVGADCTYLDALDPREHSKERGHNGARMRLDVAIIVELQTFGIVVGPQTNECAGERHRDREGYCEGEDEDGDHEEVEHGGRWERRWAQCPAVVVCPTWAPARSRLALGLRNRGSGRFRSRQMPTQSPRAPVPASPYPQPSPPHRSPPRWPLLRFPVFL